MCVCVILASVEVFNKQFVPNHKGQTSDSAVLKELDVISVTWEWRSHAGDYGGKAQTLDMDAEHEL